MYFKNYEEVKQAKIKELNHEKERLLCLNSLEWATKKDGTPFQAINKNFKNAFFTEQYPGSKYGYLTIRFYKENQKGASVYHSEQFYIRATTIENNNNNILLSIKHDIQEETKTTTENIKELEQTIKQLGKINDDYLKAVSDYQNELSKLAKKYNKDFSGLFGLEEIRTNYADYSDHRNEIAKAKFEAQHEISIIKCKCVELGYREQELLKQDDVTMKKEFSKNYCLITFTSEKLGYHIQFKKDFTSRFSTAIYSVVG